MDDDAGNGVGAGQSHVLPRLSGVDRFVHAGTRVRTAEDVGLAGAHPHDVRVRRRNRDIADGGRGALIEDRLPRGRLVLGLPQAAGRRRGVDRVVLAPGRDDGHVEGAAADVLRAEELPLEVLEGRRGLHGLVRVESFQSQRGIRRRHARWLLDRRASCRRLAGLGTQARGGHSEHHHCGDEGTPSRNGLRSDHHAVLLRGAFVGASY